MNATVTEVHNVDSTRKLQTGGTLNPKRHIYIRRPEDDEVLRLLLAGEYVNVLTSRQMGKSSLMAQTAFALQDQGVRVVSIDLAGELGSPKDSASYYRALLQRIARSLELLIDLKAWWQEHELESDNQKLLRFFKDEVGGAIDGPVVIFLDEIDSTLKLPFTDDLFTALRTMNNERAFDEAYQRLTFCLLGVATPNELIQDRRTTPYNVGRTLELRDFETDRDDLNALIHALHTDRATGENLLFRVLYWTGGHPYLTSRLCNALASAEVTTAEEVDQQVDTAFKTLERVSNDVHIQQILRFVGERFTRELASLDLYTRVLNGARERDQPSLAHAELKLSGLVKRNEDGCLIVRNPIYARLFDKDWVKSTKPKRTLARMRGYAIATSIALAVALGAGSLSYVFVISPQQQGLAIRQQLEERQIGVVQSEMGDGLSVQFPAEADQALLEEVAPLLLELPDKVIELDLQIADAVEKIVAPEAHVVEISDLMPLVVFQDLRRLDLDNTQVEDLRPLENLTDLRTLWLDNPEITDLRPLENLTALRELTFNNAQVEDLSPLKHLTALQALSLENTQVKDLSPLENLTDLRKLYLANTQVKDLRPLENLEALQTLSLRGTQVPADQFSAFLNDRAERGITIPTLFGPDSDFR